MSKAEKILGFGRRVIPAKIFNFFQPAYHCLLAFLAALIYWFPSRKIFVLGITGTKGKTSVLEIINAILEEAGYKTAMISTLRFKIGRASSRNNLKMTMPGRLQLQRFLRMAVERRCKYFLMEATSQGVLQFRHKFIELDSMIFTNLSPEHIEAHGSFEKYKKAKLEFFKALKKSSKKTKMAIINNDDKNANDFLDLKIKKTMLYDFKMISDYRINKDGTEFVIGERRFSSKLLGEFNLYNILAAVSFARFQNIEWAIIKKALEKFKGIPGRVEFIENYKNFDVVVDYAHTPESLEKVYKLFNDLRKICVFGSAGGGRDKWKRKKMGKIAANYCDEIILTNEDPYDENPMAIVREISSGIEGFRKYRIILDRREAIFDALKIARAGNIVIITGKGTDPWIMGPRGTKIKWDDREVVREELKKL